MGFHHTDTGALLAAVVLLLHQQIEFVERPGIGAVFLPVVFQRFAQAYHRHATFMF